MKTKKKNWCACGFPHDPKNPHKHAIKEKMGESYKITISKTADGKQDYMQIISADQFSTNIVLIGNFELQDARTKKEKPNAE